MNNKRSLARRLRLAPVALAAMLAVAGCGKGDKDKAPEAIQNATVVTVRPTAVPMTVELPGRLDAYRQAQVRARVAGIVTARTYEEGQEVKQGAVLFRIDPAPLKAARDAAQGALAKAQAAALAASDKRRRYDDLVRDHAVSERDHTEAVADDTRAKADVASAKAELARAQLQLDYATVTAPISGRARRALVTEGALVGQDQATPLTTVEQLDPIYVNFSQPAADVDALRRAVKSGHATGIAQHDVTVTLRRADGTAYPLKGKLLFSDLAVDPTTDTVAMRALFPNPERELLPGAYVRIALDAAVDQRAILVPRDALLRTAERTSVRVVGTNGKVKDVEVVADQMSGRDWRITRGLSGGERVIVDNAAQFAPDTAVKPVEQASPTKAAQPAAARQT
ncbi:MexX/AxyX family multidrug efflux RND transporter periplasmic adaptor subunit [Burkholderia ambifaria]|uniref:Efflux transporter, RND family, MFP subunit n=1 Tax=Burkholderia ambifaria (strain ATCC BAA-244 / DSM 16087 / CCUG 44356 / LMG 19182 / AMMD) TaxID=339670 RepID=Q0BFJ5_BURCM|nr:MexX/AxyX family multidrug efflux RND transporter periplasmic adaptor subunit [Burkholderia ambifaria]ABI87078.1 efflux transporter, RND family, MFP subunit [Burkholderia ambifaria AMMD]AJY20735.1 efflux transporter, RND family, MFP subunit [Burkholderia ambifaria AMMD]ELK6209555.1 MexX/AxyX family multidrug efflux RND transporter periplasmic adaptor subunit [Burkholderia ambifaria]ELK6211257.1 MexX/AxyX family multidrug efflux RND transporter periplasmic adaptor subunit [Burkholderia ambifa